MKKTLYFIIGGIFIILLFSYFINYYYKRKIYFYLYKVIELPYEEFDEYNSKYFHILDSQSSMCHYLIDMQGYDSLYVFDLMKQLNFEVNDYIISYNKELVELSYSPYLSRSKDGCGYLKDIPLIPLYNDFKTDSVFIYRTSKLHGYRVPCP
jgi:hypothetical protein